MLIGWHDDDAIDRHRRENGRDREDVPEVWRVKAAAEDGNDLTFVRCAGANESESHDAEIVATTIASTE
jgi:hypothetical protein